MIFADIVAALSKEIGTEIETEGDVCAIRAGATDGTSVTVILHGLDECGAVLLAADIGEPPPEGRDRLLRVLLEANDLFRNTAGATLSLDPDRGCIRLQRAMPADTLAQGGVGVAFAAFADTADAWQQLVADFRAAPPDAPAGRAADGEPPPHPGIFA
jgi:hypothetical protein